MLHLNQLISILMQSIPWSTQFWKLQVLVFFFPNFGENSLGTFCLLDDAFLLDMDLLVDGCLVDSLALRATSLIFMPSNLAWTIWDICVYTKIWEEHGNSKLPRLYHQGIDCKRIDISRFRCGTEIGSLQITSADNINKLWLASGESCRTLQKGKD